MGWLTALGVVLLLSILPLGVNVNYDCQGPLVRIIAGPVKIPVFPAPKREKKNKKKTEMEKKEAAAVPAASKGPQQLKSPAPPKQKKPKTEGGNLRDFLPFVKLAFDFLGDFRRKLRLNHLYLKLVMAADDPCDLAVNYGRAWAAVGNLMPQLEKIFVIKKRDVDVECDFTAAETRITARLDVTITLGRLLGLVFTYAIRALIQFLKMKQKRKGGAENEPKTS